ncbi:PepSY domain-containing protein [Geothrix sp. PMB-07]|uniref:PepSY domain-containing protein n=1 Tax=Geothrix sp. PMB-07 TaxID=3068640 RepID=UPI0027422BDB|nr:PepSY domain-containing protein [Geothrix sp. PMB-07]WLT32561.1 PepSY domain-containing protein [Geothrix sp. PMB-07]
MRIASLALALAMAFVIPAATLSAAGSKSHKHASGPVKSAKEAKAIAEQDTGGKATSARRVPLNGASGGWEVDVRMPHESQGWRCVVDADTHMVHTKTRIDQPGAKGKSEGPVRIVKGSR